MFSFCVLGGGFSIFNIIGIESLAYSAHCQQLGTNDVGRQHEEAITQSPYCMQSYIFERIYMPEKCRKK